jgi:hypothetical protein
MKHNDAGAGIHFQRRLSEYTGLCQLQHCFWNLYNGGGGHNASKRL